MIYTYILTVYTSACFDVIPYSWETSFKCLLLLSGSISFENNYTFSFIMRSFDGMFAKQKTCKIKWKEIKWNRSQLHPIPTLKSVHHAWFGESMFYEIYIVIKVKFKVKVAICLLSLLGFSGKIFGNHNM